jgi:hypothetical protein
MRRSQQRPPQPVLRCGQSCEKTCPRRDASRTGAIGSCKTCSFLAKPIKVRRFDIRVIVRSNAKAVHLVDYKNQEIRSVFFNHNSFISNKD